MSDLLWVLCRSVFVFCCSVEGCLQCYVLSVLPFPLAGARGLPENKCPLTAPNKDTLEEKTKQKPEAVKISQ